TVSALNGPRIRATDRLVDRINPMSYYADKRRKVSAIVQQKGDFTEATTVGFTLASGQMVRVPVGGDKLMNIPEMGATITPLGDKKWRIDVELPGEPEQVAADPD